MKFIHARLLRKVSLCCRKPWHKSIRGHYGGLIVLSNQKKNIHATHHIHMLMNSSLESDHCKTLTSVINSHWNLKHMHFRISKKCAREMSMRRWIYSFHVWMECTYTSTETVLGKRKAWRSSIFQHNVIERARSWCEVVLFYKKWKWCKGGQQL